MASVGFVAVPARAAPLATSAASPSDPRPPAAQARRTTDSQTGLSVALASLTGAAVAASGSKSSRRRRTAMQAEATVLPKVDRNSTKAFRSGLNKSDQYHRFSPRQLEGAMKDLMSVSGSEFITEMRKNGFRVTVGDVTFVLAQSYGFCWGVERAVAMAYEARNFFPDKSLWVTNEIIHNPLVNENLTNMGFKFVQSLPGGGKDFSPVSPGDVVCLPAFGASVDEMAFLKENKNIIVDTTCPWVAKVWNSVERSKSKGHTSIIHGKYNHEETVATKSFAAKYIVVKDMSEAEYVAKYMLGEGNREEFMEKFSKALSEGFDPDTDLDRVGIANQTTMLKGETSLIGKLFERTMIKKFGPQELNEHFVSFNTICDATQERQDAMYEMLGAEYEAPSSKLYADLEGEQVGIELVSTKEEEKLSSKKMEAATRGGSDKVAVSDKRIDMCLVVGGFNSSNTTHLVEIALEENVPGYHIDCADRIGGGNRIEYKPLETTPAEAMKEEGLLVKEGFLPQGPVVIGLTSGASTPDNILGEVCQRILELRAK